MNLLKPILDIFLPTRCLLCFSDTASDSLCPNCKSLCHECPVGNFCYDPEHKGALFYYEYKIKDCLRLAKFSCSYMHVRLVRDLIKEEIIKNNHMKHLKTYAPTAITYVPTHWLRKSMRGFDVPSMFAHMLGEYLHVPVINLLEKNKLIKPQSSISNKNERILAVKNLYKLRSKKNYYQKLILVDDIVTTGATFDACGKILREVSKDIKFLAFAKTP